MSAGTNGHLALIMTRIITSAVIVANRHADRHRREARWYVSSAIDMIAMLHHDLKLFVNFVILGLSSGCQIRLQIIIGIHAVRRSGRTALILFLIEGLQ